MIAEANKLLEELDNLTAKQKVKSTLENIGKTRTKARKQAITDYAYLDEERCLRFKRIYAIVDHYAKSFAESAAIEESFILSLTNACYQAVEDGGYIRQNDLKDIILKIIGISVKKFSHGFQCALRCFEIIQRIEHGPTFAVELVHLLSTSYSNATVLRDVIAGILKARPEELVLDSGNVKNISTFLVELAEKYPSLIISPINCFEPLSNLLERDPYSLRIAVLSMAAGIVRHSKNQRQEEKDMELISDCIEALKAHSMDVNAFVRGKTLQLFQGLIKELCLPAFEQLAILGTASARLFDKSSIVRKYAIQLLGTLVEVNQLALRLAIDGNQLKPEKSENDELVAGLAEFAEFSVKFSEIVREKVIPFISELIESKTTTDLTESVDFLIISTEYGLASLSEPILLRSLDNLTTADIEQPIKTEILDAFDRLYIQGRPPNVVIENLVRLLNLIETFSSLDGFGEMLIGQYKASKLPTSFFTELIRQFSLNSTEFLRKRQLGLLICLLSSTRPPQLVKAGEHLMKIASESEDIFIVKFSIDSLFKLLKIDNQRLKSNHKYFQILSTVSTAFLEKSSVDVDWFSLFRSCCMAVYELGDNPEKIIVPLINEFHQIMMKQDGCELTATRFFYGIGEIAMRHYIFLDGPVLKHLKKSKKSEKPRKAGDEGQTNELEMALGCATAPDVESDAVISLLNNLVTDPEYLLTNFVPIISKDATSSSPSFASLLCLVKFMLISSPVAQVLMPVFEKALDLFLASDESTESSKNSLLVGLADLFIRFPTITGKISEFLFKCLHSKNAASQLRQTALIIVSYLAMNDMLRIRDHLADIAVASLDQDPTIRSLSKELIVEIATRNNALYNAMANVLSKLAAPVDEGGLVESDKDFEEIIGFLFKLVTKDKQTDQLLMRILTQLKTMNNTSYVRRLSTCILFLPLTEKSLNAFNSNFAMYSEHLVDDVVYATFVQAISKLKPSSNAAQAKNLELKDQIEELLSKFSGAHNPEICVKVDENAVDNENGEAVKPKFATPALVGRPGKGRPRASVAKTPLTVNNERRTTRTAKSAVKGEPKSAAKIKRKRIVDSDSE